MILIAFGLFLVIQASSSYEIPPNLKPFIEAPVGLALTVHGRYLSRWTYSNVEYIFGSKANKDPLTRFFARETDDGLLALECDKEGYFVQVVDRHVPSDRNYRYFGLECYHIGSPDGLAPWDKFQVGIMHSTGFFDTFWSTHFRLSLWGVVIKLLCECPPMPNSSSGFTCHT